MSEETCETCRFWRWTWTEDKGAEDEVVVGECRIRAPKMMPPTDDNRFTGQWPQVIGGDWCGEYQARVPLGMVQLSPELDFGPPDVGAKVGGAMGDRKAD